uniref:Uncharacterized protein n=1 Tax=Ditylenchus dipsaci TaxID=166011 RepID=A0A915CMG9_9BILA
MPNTLFCGAIQDDGLLELLDDAVHCGEPTTTEAISVKQYAIERVALEINFAKEYLVHDKDNKDRISSTVPVASGSQEKLTLAWHFEQLAFCLQGMRDKKDVPEDKVSAAGKSCRFHCYSVLRRNQIGFEEGAGKYDERILTTDVVKGAFKDNYGLVVKLGKKYEQQGGTEKIAFIDASIAPKNSDYVKLAKSALVYFFDHVVSIDEAIWQVVPSNPNDQVTAENEYKCRAKGCQLKKTFQDVQSIEGHMIHSHGLSPMQGNYDI